jgi:hypothetical protein
MQSKYRLNLKRSVLVSILGTLSSEWLVINNFDSKPQFFSSAFCAWPLVFGALEFLWLPTAGTLF